MVINTWQLEIHTYDKNSAMWIIAIEIIASVVIRISPLFIESSSSSHTAI